MEVERVIEIIRKAKAILPLIKTPANKALASMMILAMEESCKIIKEQSIPCPPDLEDKLEKAFIAIEHLYDKNATN